MRNFFAVQTKQPLYGKRELLANWTAVIQEGSGPEPQLRSGSNPFYLSRALARVSILRLWGAALRPRGIGTTIPQTRRVRAEYAKLAISSFAEYRVLAQSPIGCKRGEYAPPRGATKLLMH